MMVLSLMLAAAVAVDFDSEIGRIRPELHSSGFGPQVGLCSKERVDQIKSMGFKAARTHDWALINHGQRVCDYYHIFPLMHLDAKDPRNYVFTPTDNLLRKTREETGLDIFYRLGPSIEHADYRLHFNSLIPEDFDKVAEVFAATVRHYNKGWANGYEWGIKYWEIWNEPDLRRHTWSLPDGNEGIGETQEERDADFAARETRRRELFVKLFVTVLKRLKSEFPDIKVGGPALCRLAEYVPAVLNGCKEAGIAPDFLSWHHYTSDPGSVMKAINRARKMCDDYGFTDCELIVNEWHYFGPYEWSDMKSEDPEVQKRVWAGPAGHYGIESSCFNLALLSKFQTSKLDQAYYYGCDHMGLWGYMDANRVKYKLYYGLKIFGDFIKRHQVICKSDAEGGLTVLAAKSGGDAGKKGILVTAYHADVDEITIDVKGVGAEQSPEVWLHDNTHDLERIPVSFTDGKLVLKKSDRNSAAFLILF